MDSVNGGKDVKNGRLIYIDKIPYWLSLPDYYGEMMCQIILEMGKAHKDIFSVWKVDW